jgi:hypothetical protein
MNPQETVKTSQFPADIYPVFSGNRCRVIDNKPHNKSFLFDACQVSAALNIGHLSTVFGRVA